jgi:hypothetical protein
MDEKTWLDLKIDGTELLHTKYQQKRAVYEHIFNRTDYFHLALRL